MPKGLHSEIPVKERDYVSVTAGDEQVAEMLAFMVFRKIKRILEEQERNKTSLEAGKSLMKEETGQ